MTERFHTIDGETLTNQPLTPIRFVVDNLLSQGLHLLAGAPKCGKSWLALWLSVTVAKGEEVWGNMVRRGTTLYLCFEDSRLRIQNRLFDITEDAPPNVHFCEESCRLGDGLEQRIERFVAEHPDTVLIIIDTLQMIRNVNGDNSYANDYAEVYDNLGKYGNLCLKYLHEQKPHMYRELLFTGRLAQHCEDVEQTALDMAERIRKQYFEKCPAPAEGMERIQAFEQAQMIADEIVLAELICR